MEWYALVALGTLAGIVAGLLLPPFGRLAAHRRRVCRSRHSCYPPNFTGPAGHELRVWQCEWCGARWKAVTIAQVHGEPGGPWWRSQPVCWTTWIPAPRTMWGRLRAVRAWLA